MVSSRSTPCAAWRQSSQTLRCDRAWRRLLRAAGSHTLRSRSSDPVVALRRSPVDGGAAVTSTLVPWPTPRPFSYACSERRQLESVSHRGSSCTNSLKPCDLHTSPYRCRAGSAEIVIAGRSPLTSGGYVTLHRSHQFRRRHRNVSGIAAPVGSTTVPEMPASPPVCAHAAELTVARIPPAPPTNPARAQFLFLNEGLSHWPKVMQS